MIHPPRVTLWSYGNKNLAYFRMRRKGTILPLIAVAMLALMGIAALAVDIGSLALAKAQFQMAADAAAFAGARYLDDNTKDDFSKANNTAKAAGLAAISKHKVFGNSIQTGEVTTKVGYYSYNTNQKKFELILPVNGSKPVNEAWSAVQSTISSTPPNQFSKVFNYSPMNMTAQATAVHRPRDITIVLDFSGSMRFGSLCNYPWGGTIQGSMNADTRIPKFGGWSNAAIQNRMFRATPYIDANGDVQAAANISVETSNGPPLVLDFYTRDNAGVYTKAFHRDMTPYNWRTQPDLFALPAPDNFDVQSNTPVQFTGTNGTNGYGGDRWPKLNGFASAFPNNTGSTYAFTVQQYLAGNNTIQSNTHNKNATFETNGYPNFQGFTIGPGYYGKTFYIWPPDPRPANDWRKKFFYSTNTSNPLDDNSLLFNTNGTLKDASNTTYKINYSAVINWLNSGPRVFPQNLRAGRILYYDAIPTSIPDSGGTPDQRFWRAYIDFVIGSASAAEKATHLYGTNTSSTGPAGTNRITAKSSLNTNLTNRPYMHYNDVPAFPVGHFWFGPITMIDFLSNYATGRNWMPGTAHEAATWQLKAGIQSALADMQKNHPNDQAGLIFFSNLNNYSIARVNLGKDFTRMKNSLFYPYSLLDTLSDPNSEIRPYTNNFYNAYLAINSNGLDESTNTQGIIPNANGGTNPEMAFMVAYNQLSSSGAFTGRVGASKMLIFETDGRPTGIANGNFNAGNPNTNSSNFSGINDAGGASSVAAANRALNRLQALCNMSNAAQPGFSTSKNPVRAHAIAFGYLFEPGNASQASTDAMNFLVNVQTIGKTLPAGATSIEDFKIIIGTATERIDKLRNAFERILQSGIQITLIQ